jgi:hypothetical protein
MEPCALEESRLFSALTSGKVNPSLLQFNRFLRTRTMCHHCGKSVPTKGFSRIGPDNFAAKSNLFWLQRTREAVTLFINRTTRIGLN